MSVLFATAAAGATRPDSWHLPLFVHILGAMIATGGLVLALIYLVAAWRGDSPAMFRAGFKALLYGAIPGYIVMRGAAQWIYSKEGLDNLPTDPNWIGIGFAVADLGLLFLLIATITSGVASKRALAAEGSDGAPRVIGVRVATVLTALLLIAYVIAVWAMSTKPI
jgi:hypothetical protein